MPTSDMETWTCHRNIGCWHQGQGRDSIRAPWFILLFARRSRRQRLDNHGQTNGHKQCAFLWCNNAINVCSIEPVLASLKRRKWPGTRRMAREGTMTLVRPQQLECVAALGARAVGAAAAADTTASLILVVRVGTAKDLVNRRDEYHQDQD